MCVDSTGNSCIHSFQSIAVVLQFVEYLASMHLLCHDKCLVESGSSAVDSMHAILLKLLS